MGSLFLSSFTVPSSFLLNNNVKFAYGQEEIQMDTNGDGVVDAADNPIPSDTTNTSSTPPPEEIQMDTNGDGVVDEFESQNQSVTSPPEEIQMDTNGDGVVDAADNPIPSDTTNTSSTPPPEEIQMDTNGDGVVDEFESQIADELVSTRNSFIVKLRSSDAVSLNKTLDLLKPDLEAAGGDVKSIYEQFGMFNLKFDGPQQAVDRLIDKLKTDPSIEAVYNDTIITGDQSTSPVIVPPQLCDDNTAPNANGVCADRSIPHYVTLRQQTECNVGSCVTKWVRAQLPTLHSVCCLRV